MKTKIIAYIKANYPLIILCLFMVSCTFKIIGLSQLSWFWTVSPAWLPFAVLSVGYFFLMSFYYTVALINKLRR